MDIRKTSIAVLSLCAPAVWLLGCSSTIVPRRAPEMAALVRAGDLDLETGAARNDDRLGLGRGQVVRQTIRSTSATFDRQRIIDGRPFNDYRLTTRTIESLQPRSASLRP